MIEEKVSADVTVWNFKSDFGGSRIQKKEAKCSGWDSNPHSLRNQILSLARLPISPPERFCQSKA